MTHKTTRTETSTAAAAQLAEVELEIARLEAEHSSLNEQIGEALAKTRLGDKRASSDAGKLSMKRSGIESQLRDLRLTKSSLEAHVASWRDDELARRRAAAYTELEEIAAEARELEAQLAEQVRASAETARRLQTLGQRWNAPRRTAGGHPGTEALERPRNAITLFNNDTLNAPGAVDRWLAPQQTSRPSGPPNFVKHTPPASSPSFTMALSPSQRRQFAESSQDGGAA